MKVCTSSFVVHTYEVDAFDLLQVPALAGYFQEVAGLHATELGCGRDVLVPRGLAWVLIRQRIEILAPMLLGDTLVLSSWPSGAERLAALRDYRVERADGTVVATAVSHWVVFDLGARRIARLEKALPSDLFAPEAHVFPVPSGKITELERFDTERRFHVRYQDIDANLHVTNTSYVAWALEAVPQTVWQTQRLRNLDIQFVAECSYGSKVLSRCAASGEGEYLHAIVREEDGKCLARLTSAWLPREVGLSASGYPAGTGSPLG